MSFAAAHSSNGSHVIGDRDLEMFSFEFHFLEEGFEIIPGGLPSKLSILLEHHSNEKIQRMIEDRPPGRRAQGIFPLEDPGTIPRSEQSAQHEAQAGSHTITSARFLVKHQIEERRPKNSWCRHPCARSGWMGWQDK